MTLPLIGAWGTTPTYGNWYDRFIGAGIRWATATEDDYSKFPHIEGEEHFTDAKVNHAVLFVGDVAGFSGPMLVEARPGGAAFAPWDKYGDAMTWANSFDTTYGVNLMPHAPLHPEVRQAIANFGIDCALKRVGYGYADFLAIALAQKRFHNLVPYDNPPWWVRELGRPDRLICSQLVDWCYQQAGVELFDDNRFPGLVSPADLYMLTATDG